MPAGLHLYGAAAFRAAEEAHLGGDVALGCCGKRLSDTRMCARKVALRGRFRNVAGEQSLR
jgi:hypothetical protein